MNMTPENALKYLTSAMSLRVPQTKSLELFAAYLQAPAGQKVLARMKKENRTNTQEIFESSKDYFSKITSGFESFERSFPAYTFALATGVGKTRLMGAFIAYLYLVYNIQHFLIVAPNLTVYRKLVEDFSISANPKYVFRGIQEINVGTTKIITTENYANQRGATLFGNKIEINIFNIQQFAQKDMTGERGITKPWETAGESHFDYLREQGDLVVLLDEAHHYHADAALGAFDLMDPLMALEFTATPYVGVQGTGRNARPIKMKNVVYEYNLGDAIRGKLVKDPWVGTEADVDFSQFDQESIDTDMRKLQLAAFFHERAKNALKEYAVATDKPVVKPIMLVVAKDTEHAALLRSRIDSDDFRRGEFKGKVLEVHTKLRGEEADETIEKLISLEHPDNPYEIVIHVNMLKEGWDVTNVYTIAPIRLAASSILTEQTLGRGLRLPYGERTGEPLIDRLVITAHEQFSKVVEIAKTSPLIQGQVEKVSEAEVKEVKVVTEVQPVALQTVETEIRQSAPVMAAIAESVEKAISKIPQAASLEAEAKEQLITSKTKEIVGTLAKEVVTGAFEPGSLFATLGQAAQAEFTTLAKKAQEQIEIRNIPIPRLILTPHFAELTINDFDLDTSKLRAYTNERAILEEQLQRENEKTLFGEEVQGRRRVETTRVTSFGGNFNQTPQSTIIAALLDSPLVDYEDEKQQPLLLKLADQAVAHYRKAALDDDNLALIIESNASSIAQDIYTQILAHKKMDGDGYLESEVRESRRFPVAHTIILSPGATPVTLDSQVDTFNAKQYVYGPFRKACHAMYRFDSSDEARFAYVMESDSAVIDWMRPAPTQFEGLFWRDAAGDAQHRYEPDFVVELKSEIVIVEVKPTEEIVSPDVVAKKKTAEAFCNTVNKNVGKVGITKPWRYVIVPTENITIRSTAIGLLARG